MTKFNTIDPTTGKIIKSYETLSDEQVDGKIELAHKTYDIWKDSSFSRRRELLQKVGKTLIDQRQNLASIMTTEMGKRINEGLAEIDKCALVCEYYAKNSKALLKNEIIKTEAKISYVKFDPMGVVLVIMPWNFPFWQVFRAAAPAIMAGNTVLLKHASSVPECAIAIENIFFNAGAPTGLFQNLPIAGSDTKRVIENPLVRLVSLTGSEEAGATVASIAGKAIKRTILELGGSDPFIIMPDADIEKVAQVASMARMIVSGQSCIAAKRFIVHQNVVNKFTELLKANFEAKIIGDPSDPKSDVGPLSSLSTLETIHKIDDRVSAGESFEPVVSPLCDFCGYKPICPAWKHLYKNVKGEIIDGVAVPSVMKEYFQLRGEKQKAEKRLKELSLLLTRYLEAEAIDRVFGDDGVIARRRIEKYQYDFDKIRSILEPMGKWHEILGADEKKLKNILREIPEWARAEIQKARLVIRTSTTLTATKRKSKPDQISNKFQ